MAGDVERVRRNVLSMRTTVNQTVRNVFHPRDVVLKVSFPFRVARETLPTLPDRVRDDWLGGRRHLAVSGTGLGLATDRE